MVALIDLSEGTSLVEQVARIIRKDLAKAKPGDCLPPERALSERLAVSRSTVRDAVAQLEAEGLLDRRVGKGTFVSHKFATSSAAPLRLSLYTEFFPSAMMEPMLASFAPGENVAVTKFEGDYRAVAAYVKGLRQAAAAGESLDVVTLHEGVLPILAKDGLLEPLDELLAKSGRLGRESFPPALLEAFSHEGRLYGIPQTFSTYVLFYNKRSFRDAGLAFPGPGWTWEELRRAAVALTKVDAVTGINRSCGLNLFHGDVNAMTPFLYQNLPPDVALSAPAFFGRPETREALEFVLDLRRKCCLSYNESVASTDTELFTQGKLAMLIGDHGSYCGLPAALDFGVAELPGGRRKFTSLPTQGWGVGSRSPRKERAFALLERFQEPSLATAIAGKLGRLPASRGQIPPGTPAAFIDSLAFAHSSGAAFPPKLEAWQSFYGELRLLLNNFSSPQDFCDKMLEMEEER